METVTFKILGNWVNYIINGTGTHETLRFGDTCLVDASGDVGPYRSKSWRAISSRVNICDVNWLA